MRFSKLIIKSNVQKQTTKYGCGHKFQGLKYFELDFLYITWIHYKLEGIKHLYIKNSISCKFIWFKANLS